MLRQCSGINGTTNGTTNTSGEPGQGSAGGSGGNGGQSGSGYSSLYTVKQTLIFKSSSYESGVRAFESLRARHTLEI